MTPVQLTLLLSTLIQLFGVFLALRLIGTTGARGAWLFFSAAFLLMLLRRLFSFSRALLADSTILSFDLTSEIFALAISILFLIGMLAMRTELLARRQSEQAIHENFALLQAVIEGTSDAILVKNLRGRYLIVNTAGESYVGASRQDIIGKDDLELFPADTARSIVETDRKIMAAGRPQTIEETITVLNRTNIYLSTKAPYRDSTGNLIGLVTIARDITTRKQAEEALALSEKRFKELVHTIDAIVWEADASTFQFHFVSQQAEKMLGYPIADWLNKPNFWIDRLHPDDRQAAVDYCVRSTVALQNHEMEYRMITADGRTIWMRDIVTVEAMDQKPVRLRGIMFDVTRRKEARDELQRTLSLLGATLESTADGILVVDRSGKISSFNRKFLEMWRIPQPLISTLSDRQALEYVIDQLVAPKEFIQKVHELYNQPDAESFDVLEFKDGRIFERYSQPQRLDGTSVGRVWSFRDVTERKRGEQAMLQTQKLESLGVLTGGIAHDFNNLLVGILSNAGLALLELPQDSPARQTIQGIEMASQRAADLIKQLLAYSGRGHVLVEQIDLNSVVEEMAHLLQVSIGKTAAIKFNFSPNLPAVEADATQIRQVVMNLVVNASEAIGANSGVITIKTGVISADRNYFTNACLEPEILAGEYAFLEIADTGSGMDAETQAKIFDPFFTTKFTGRGLGLAAVLGIIRSHKGGIKIFSGPDQGTKFLILLPCAAAHVELPSVREMSVQPASNGGAVLVIDDDETARTVTAKVLQKFGYTPLLAADGGSGIEIFRNNAHDIACVLLDLTMPHPDGEEVFNEIRRIKSDATVLLMSGYTEQEATQRFAGRGLAGFLHKPYHPQDLYRQLQKVLQK